MNLLKKKKAIIIVGAGEMAQWCRALVAFPEDVGLTSRAHVVSHNYL